MSQSQSCKQTQLRNVLKMMMTWNGMSKNKNILDIGFKKPIFKNADWQISI